MPSFLSYAPLKTKFENFVCKISQKVFELESSYLVYRFRRRRSLPDKLLRAFRQVLTEIRNCEIFTPFLTPFLSVHLLSLLVLKSAFCAQVYSVCLHDFY